MNAYSILAALAITTQAAFSQACPSCKAFSRTERITAIRELYQEIQNSTPTKTITADWQFEDQSSSGTIVKRTYQNRLTAITVNRLTDHGRVAEHYYFQGDEPALIFTQVFTRLGFPDSRDQLRESRFYLKDGKAIRTLERKVTAKTPEQNERLETLINEVPNREVQLEEQLCQSQKIAKMLVPSSNAHELKLAFLRSSTLL